MRVQALLPTTTAPSFLWFSILASFTFETRSTTATYNKTRQWKHDFWKMISAKHFSLSAMVSLSDNIRCCLAKVMG